MTVPAFRFYPRWPAMDDTLRAAGVEGRALPALIEILERRDIELENWLENYSGAAAGASGPGATIVSAAYTSASTVALNTLFTGVQDDDIVIFQGGNAGGGPLTGRSAALNLIWESDVAITWKGSGLAWARYGDLNPATLYGWTNSANGLNVAILRNLDPTAPVADFGQSFYFDDDPIPYGNCDVPENGALFLLVWDYGHLDLALTTTNLTTAPVPVLVNGGSVFSMYIIRSFDAGNVAPTSQPGYDHVAGGDSWAGCLALLRSS